MGRSSMTKLAKIMKDDDIRGLFKKYPTFFSLANKV